ncbi:MULTISPECIES: GtrA family protein [unclassified Streptomyces]|uniref:GtrA family protein n=1 Tax=Streptomyces sp. NBC_00723 TaxID=2903673 RepID=UPI0006CD3AF8|nr:GtrA family protein [Actinobacteria bacterium OV320]
MATEDMVRAGTRTGTDAPAGGDTPQDTGTGTRTRDLRQLITYALVGGSGVLLDLGAFLLLYNVAGLHEQVANVLSTSLGITNNFVLNALFTFGKRDRLLLRYLRFYAVGLTGIALTFVLLAVFSRGLGIDPNLVKAGSLPLVLVFQFALNRKWSFA